LYGPLQGTKTDLIDPTGRIVNTWNSSLLPGVSAYMLRDGSLLRGGKFTINTTGGAGGRIERFSWEGELIWKFELANSEALLHHDFKRLPNGNILMIAWDIKTANEALAAGRDPKLTHPSQVWGERIIEVRPTGPEGGEIVWEWRLWDHLIQDFDPARQNHGIVSENPGLIDINYGASADTSDWIHMNAIDYNPEIDQIVMSSWYFNEIWVIDHSTTTASAATHRGGRSGRGGDILYRWGNPAAYKMPGDQKLFSQHNANWIEPGLPGEGHILIFNNRPGQSYSSVEEIEPPLNGNGSYRREAGEAYGPLKPAWRHEGSGTPGYYSQYFSSAQRLANGNTLITPGGMGLVLEVDSGGQEVWRHTVPLEPGADAATTPIFRSYRYEVAEPAILSKLPKPVSPVILNAASLEAGALAPGMLASAFAAALAVTTEVAPNGGPVSTLGGITISILDSGGERWPGGILFVTPGQVNFRIPAEVSLGPAQITFRSQTGLENTANVELQRTSPGFFIADADGEGPPVGYALRGTATDAISLYAKDPATGRIEPVPISLGTSDDLYLKISGTGMRILPGTASMTARIGGVPVEVTELTSDPAMPGVDQLMIGPIPSQLAGRKDVPLLLTAEGTTANVSIVSFSSQ
jgi:uncharacterized protein (TIGR03437 family)